MNCFLSYLRLALVFALLGAPAYAGPVEDCKGDDPARSIEGCTQLITARGSKEMSVASAYNRRGLAYQALGNFDRAIADYSESIRLDAKNFYARVNRGWAFNEKRDYEHALADLNEAIRLNPEYTPSYNQRGNAHRGLGDLDQAIADFSEAIRRNPSYARAHANRGRTLIEKYEYDQAIVELNEAIRLDPRAAPTFNYRGWALNEKKSYNRAFADLNEAIRLDPKYAASYNNRGNTYRARNDFERALADYSEAIRLDPDFTQAYNNRGKLFAILGETERALADFGRVLELPALTAYERQRLEAARERIARLKESPAIQPSTARRVALVIGNSAYANVGTLPNPSNDAHAIALAFRRLGFSDVMEHHDLNLPAMGQALRDFGDRAAGAEWAVVFYAGHGIEMNGTNYLVPIDAQLKRDTHVADEALSLDRVQAKVEAASKFGLVILDACRNNPFLARMVRTGAAKRSVASGLAGTEPEGNVLVVYSAKHGTEAEDGDGQNSPFTKALLAHLEEPGLEVTLLFRRVRDDVRERTEQRQEPFTYGTLGSDLLFFRPGPPR